MAGAAFQTVPGFPAPYMGAKSVPRTRESAINGLSPKDHCGKQLYPSGPTKAIPGTEEKVIALIERHSLNQQLWHHLDAQLPFTHAYTGRKDNFDNFYISSVIPKVNLDPVELANEAELESQADLWASMEVVLNGRKAKAGAA